MDFKALASKKVFGVPVLYLGAAAVLILAVVAWKLKPSEEARGDENTTGDSVPDDAGDSPATDYSGLTSGGTVTVVQQGNATETEAEKETNDDWERAAVKYLIEDTKAEPQAAQIAISKYLEGADMSYAEGQLKDAAVKKLGLPPEKMVTVGQVGTAPAQKQFSLFPGTHTVKGVNDNTPAKVALLYYGNASADHMNRIVASNVRLGPMGTTYPTGTRVTVPAWTNPRYHTVTASTRSPHLVAAKNAMDPNVVVALNPGVSAPYNVGAKIRIQ